MLSVLIVSSSSQQISLERYCISQFLGSQVKNLEKVYFLGIRHQRFKRKQFSVLLSCAIIFIFPKQTPDTTNQLFGITVNPPAVSAALRDFQGLRKEEDTEFWYLI